MISALEKQIENMFASGCYTVDILEAIRAEALTTWKTSLSPELAVAVIDLMDQKAGQAAALSMKNLASFFRNLREARRAEFDHTYITHLKQRKKFVEAQDYERSRAGVSALVSVRDELSDLLVMDSSDGYSSFAESVGDFGQLLLLQLLKDRKLFAKNFKGVSCEALIAVNFHWPRVAARIKRVMRKELLANQHESKSLTPVLVQNLANLSEQVKNFLATDDELAMVNLYLVSSFK